MMQLKKVSKYICKNKGGVREFVDLIIEQNISKLKECHYIMLVK